MYYPVAVAGAFFSIGDPHAAQGDSELGGTAIETSLTGEFEFILHKRHDLGGTILEGLSTRCWRRRTNGRSMASRIRTISPNSGRTRRPGCGSSSIDRAMRDAFRKMRRFLMTVHKLSEDEAIALMSVAADFGITQVVDGNWGVHGTIRKACSSAHEFAGWRSSFAGAI